MNALKILVHCNAGISRSSTFVISYLMKYQQRTLDEALGMVKAVRPVIRPNDGFMHQLKMFENKLGISDKNMLG
uniref:protein-tyrosine-phosphatase n=1 Tax=Heterorhabditis bacteriophora TaxID=37862 RepID=A0A1I7X3R8_HETBA